MKNNVTNYVKQEKKRVFGITPEMEKIINRIVGNNDMVYKRSVQEVIDSFSAEDKKVYDELLSQKTLSKEYRILTMETAKAIIDDYGYNLNHPCARLLKAQAFGDCASELIYHAINILANYETSLSFAELVYIGKVYGLEKAWLSFMQKTKYEIQKSISERKAVFASFKTYAQYAIRLAMSTESRSENKFKKGVNLPHSTSYKISFILKVVGEALIKEGRRITNVEIAERTNFSVKTINELSDFINRFEYEINESESLDNVKLETIEDELVSKDLNPEDSYVLKHSLEYVRTSLDEFLSEKEKDIFLSYSGLFGTKVCTFEALSEKHKRTKERIRQIYNEALKKIKERNDIIDVLRTIAEIRNKAA